MPSKVSPAKSEAQDRFVESVERLMQEHHLSPQMLRETNIEGDAAKSSGPEATNVNAKRFLSRTTLDRMFEKASVSVVTVPIKRDVVRVLRMLIPHLAWHDNVDVCVSWLNGGDMPSAVDGDGPIKKMTEELRGRIEGAQNFKGMMEAILAFTVDDEKSRFWNVINRMAAELNLQDFQIQLRQAGLPPGIPVQPGETTLAVAERIMAGHLPLTAPQQIVWSLVIKAYPPRPNGGAYPGLKDAARWLAKYWNVGVVKPAKQKCSRKKWKWNWNEVRPSFAGRKLEIWLLSWLELPLVMQTNDENEGKVYMFELGQWLQNNQRRPPSS